MVFLLAALGAAIFLGFAAAFGAALAFAFYRTVIVRLHMHLYIGWNEVISKLTFCTGATGSKSEAAPPESSKTESSSKESIAWL